MAYGLTSVPVASMPSSRSASTTKPVAQPTSRARGTGKNRHNT